MNTSATQFVAALVCSPASAMLPFRAQTGRTHLRLLSITTLRPILMRFQERFKEEYKQQNSEEDLYALFSFYAALTDRDRRWHSHFWSHGLGPVHNRQDRRHGQRSQWGGNRWGTDHP